MWQKKKKLATKNRTNKKYDKKKIEKKINLVSNKKLGSSITNEIFLGQPFAILWCSWDIVTFRLNWPRGQFAHAYVLHRLYMYTLISLTMSLRLSIAIKKLLWTMSLYLTTNCYYILFTQQQLGKITKSWK